MRPKILLCGNNRTLINDFFVHMDSTFECMITSGRQDDVMCHIKYFEPDSIVYCLYRETKEFLNAMAGLKTALADKDVPIVVIGSQEDCEELSLIAPGFAQLELHRPISSRDVMARLLKLVENRDLQKQIMEDAIKEAEVEEERKPEAGGREEAEAGSGKETEGKKEGLFETKDFFQDFFGDFFGADGGMPVAEVSMEPEGSAEPEEQEGPEEQKEPQGPKHILIVDDDAGMLRMMKNFLSRNYQVATAISGKVALKFLEVKNTDLVLLDYEMPGENGSDVLKQIRSNPKWKELPVVFLTGVTDKDRIRQVVGNHIQGYLLKPINMERLSSTISELIG